MPDGQTIMQMCQCWFPMDTRICPFGSPFGNLLACQIVCNVSQIWSCCRRNTTGFIWWLMWRSQISRCFYDVLRCSYDHFQTLGGYDAWVIMCPYRQSTSGQCDPSIKEIFTFGRDHIAGLTLSQSSEVIVKEKEFSYYKNIVPFVRAL